MLLRSNCVRRTTGATEHRSFLGSNRLGDIAVVRGELSEALKSYRDGLVSPSAWPRPALSECQ
jgi:hypothetical protein